MVTKNEFIDRLFKYDAQLYRAIEIQNNNSHEDNLMGASAQTRREDLKEIRGLLHKAFPEFLPDMSKEEARKYYRRKHSS